MTGAGHRDLRCAQRSAALDGLLPPWAHPNCRQGPPEGGVFSSGARYYLQERASPNRGPAVLLLRGRAGLATSTTPHGAVSEGVPEPAMRSPPGEEG